MWSIKETIEALETFLPTESVDSYPPVASGAKRRLLDVYDERFGRSMRINDASPEAKRQLLTAYLSANDDIDFISHAENRSESVTTAEAKALIKDEVDTCFQF